MRVLKVQCRFLVVIAKKKKQNTAHKYEAPIKEMISQSS